MGLEQRISGHGTARDASGRRYNKGTLGARDLSSLYVLAAAAYTPLRVLLANPHKFPHVERLLWIVFGYWVVGIAWLAALRRIGMTKNAALGSTIVLVLLLSGTGDLAYRHSTLVAALVVIGAAIATGLILHRLGEGLASAFAQAMIAFLCVSIVVVGVLNNWESGETHVEDVEPLLPTQLLNKPDIFIVVLDGFPGRRAQLEVYDTAIPFKPRSDVSRVEAWAAYPMTIASLSSLLEMGYPLGDGAVINRQTTNDLARILAGSNSVSAFLRKQGYVATKVESGYSHSWCGASVDNCVTSPFLDEGTFYALRKSLLGLELMKHKGSAFTQGGLGAMSWLLSNLPALAENSEPDFVFGSVLVPHPPLMLDRDCNVKYDYWRVGNSLFAGSALVASRQVAYIDQAHCVASFEDALFESVPGDAIMIVMSDHGGDSLGQLALYEHRWSEQEKIERLNAHLSLRAGTCSVDAPTLIPELMERLLWCLAERDRPLSVESRRAFTMSRVGEPNVYRLDAMDAANMAALGVISRPR